LGSSVQTSANCGRWPACWKVWHAKCYRYLGKGKILLQAMEMKEATCGSRRNNVPSRSTRVSRGCMWLLNGKSRGSPPHIRDDACVMCICQENLDTMGGRAMSTIGLHAVAVKQTVTNCDQIRKTSTLPARGPMPLVDHLVMGIAMEMLFNSLTAKPRIKGEAHIQFDLI
jgi:hypothetical protein